MNIDWAHGGTSLITPAGVPLVGPRNGAQMVYGELQADMIKVAKAIVDSIGYYARPDVLQLMVRRNEQWTPAEHTVIPEPIEIVKDALRRVAEHHDVDEIMVEQIANR